MWDVYLLTLYFRFWGENERGLCKSLMSGK